MSKKEDLRIIKTKNSIKEAFSSLVEMKGYKRISVKDIVDLAQINRNTFYLHYEGKEDLVKNLILEAAANMNNALGTYVDSRSYTAEEINEIQIRYGIRNLLRLMKPELEFYRIVLLDEDLQGYIRELYKMLESHLAVFLKVNNPSFNLVYQYTINGLIGVITQWIIYSPENDVKTSKILAKLTYNSLKQLSNA